MTPRLDLDGVLVYVQQYGRSEYLRGLEDGLRVAERIVGWLTEQPDTARQQRHREWAKRAIREARERAGLV